MKYKLDEYFYLYRNRYLLLSLPKRVHNEQNDEHNESNTDERVGKQRYVKGCEDS